MERKQLEKIITYTRKVLSIDKTGHDMGHVERVVKMAGRIAEFEECDLFIVSASAYLHDTVDDKIIGNPDEAYKCLENFLIEINVTSKKIKEIIHIIKNISFSKSLSSLQEKLSIEGQIVQDADRLDAMGAIGIARTFYYGGAKGRKLYDEKIPPRNLTSKEEYREGNDTTINHFYEKILLLNDKLNTTYAKKIGEERQKFLEAFLTEFLIEVNSADE